MIIIISNEPSIWANDFSKYLAKNKQHSVVFSVRDLLLSEWSVDFHNNYLNIKLNTVLVSNKHLVRGIIFAHIDFFWSPKCLKEEDTFYYKYSWLSLFTCLQHLQLPVYNCIDLGGIRDSWRELYSLVEQKGFTAIMTDFYNLDLSIQIKQA